MDDHLLIRSLREICLFLENQTDFVLVGGLAVGIWTKPRATVDIDLLISVSVHDWKEFKERLTASGQFVFIHEKPFIFKKISFLRASLKSNVHISVDFLFADDDFKNEALKRRKTVTLADFSVHIPTPEDLILLKLLSGREQDKLDVVNIIEVQGENLDRAHLQYWSKKLGIDYVL
jgi:hypothetical protein